jgi:hypothetical protein
VVNKEVEQQFWRRDVTLENRRNLFSNVNILGKAAVLHFALYSSVAGAMPNSAYRLFDTAVLMSRSHTLLILRSPHKNFPLSSSSSPISTFVLLSVPMNFILWNHTTLLPLCQAYFT